MRVSSCVIATMADRSSGQARRQPRMPGEGSPHAPITTSSRRHTSTRRQRLLLKPWLRETGTGSYGGSYELAKDPEYQELRDPQLPATLWRRPARRGLAFFKACVQQVFAKPREGHIRCSNCHNAGIIGFAPPPGDGRDSWNDAEANRAFQLISRVIVPGDPDHSRFLLKPLHPDAGGSYAHNGVRRWQSRGDRSINAGRVGLPQARRHMCSYPSARQRPVSTECTCLP